jgi:hypothetical protein
MAICMTLLGLFVGARRAETAAVLPWADAEGAHEGAAHRRERAGELTCRQAGLAGQGLHRQNRARMVYPGSHPRRDGDVAVPDEDRIRVNGDGREPGRQRAAAVKTPGLTTTMDL